MQHSVSTTPNLSMPSTPSATNVQKYKSLLKRFQDVDTSLQNLQQIHLSWLQLSLRRLEFVWIMVRLFLAGMFSRAVLQQARVERQMEDIQERFSEITSIPLEVKNHIVKQKEWLKSIKELVEFDKKRERLIWECLAIIFPFVIFFIFPQIVRLLTQIAIDIMPLTYSLVHNVIISIVIGLIFLIGGCVISLKVTVFLTATALRGIIWRTNQERRAKFTDLEIQYSLLLTLSELERNPLTWNQGETSNGIIKDIHRTAHYLDYKSQLAARETKIAIQQKDTHLFKAATRLYFIASLFRTPSQSTYNDIVQEIATDLQICIYGHFGDLPTSDEPRISWVQQIKNKIQEMGSLLAPGAIFLIASEIIRVTTTNLPITDWLRGIGIVLIALSFITVLSNKSNDILNTVFAKLLGK